MPDTPLPHRLYMGHIIRKKSGFVKASAAKSSRIVEYCYKKEYDRLWEANQYSTALTRFKPRNEKRI
jgi:hypothetical protein